MEVNYPTGKMFVLNISTKYCHLMTSSERETEESAWEKIIEKKKVDERKRNTKKVIQRNEEWDKKSEKNKKKILEREKRKKMWMNNKIKYNKKK